MIELDTRSPEETRQLGARLGRIVTAGDVILLNGTLGAGKTHFAQGIARGLDVRGAVRSPTFTLINEYNEGRLPLYHIDLYRTEGNADLATLGLLDYFEGDGVIVIEWSEKGGLWLPEEALSVTITPLDETHRRFRFEPIGTQATRIADLLTEHVQSKE